MKRIVLVVTAFAALALAAGQASALNPQPLPPGGKRYGMYERFNKVQLNPQPLPPKPFRRY